MGQPFGSSHPAEGKVRLKKKKKSLMCFFCKVVYFASVSIGFLSGVLVVFISRSFLWWGFVSAKSRIRALVDLSVPCMGLFFAHENSGGEVRYFIFRSINAETFCGVGWHKFVCHAFHLDALASQQTGQPVYS